MTNTILTGGDLMNALDWLCLNIQNGMFNYLNASYKSLEPEYRSKKVEIVL